MKKLLTTITAALILACGCTTGGEAIMKVNGEVITKKQFDQVFDEFMGSSPFFAGNKDSIKNSKDNLLYGIFKDKVVNELIYATLLKQEIKKRNIIVTDEDYAKEIEFLSSILGSKAELNNFLKSHGISPASFKKSTYERLKMQKLAESISKIEVTEDEVANYYKKRKQAFSYPEKVRASHILVLADEKEYAAELKKKNPEISETDLDARIKEEMANRKLKAEAILKEVKNNPKDFAKIAKAKSDDRTSAKMGGELGFFARRDMVKEFSDAAFSLPVNKISDLVKTKYGYHIILVTDRAEAGTYPYAKVKREIEQKIKNRKQMDVIDGLATALKNSAKIEILDKEYETSELQKMIDENMAEDAQ